MPIIYRPKGKAKEYNNLAANLYRGCYHKCAYCYSPTVTHVERTQFHSPEFISPRKDVLKLLAKDAKRYHGCMNNVLMSFTTDPYQPIEKELKITREAIKILNREYIGVTILTKGGKLAERDFDLLKRGPMHKNQFGVTLTCDEDELSKEWEPNASLPHERIKSLRLAHDLGIYTYVSFEPVLYTVDVYNLIQLTHTFVNFYKIGKLNYHPHSKMIDWPVFRENVINVLNDFNCDFMIKKDLMEAK